MSTIPTLLNCSQVTLDAIAANPNLSHLLPNISIEAPAEDIIAILNEYHNKAELLKKEYAFTMQTLKELDYALALSNPVTKVISNEEFNNYFNK